MTSEEQPADMFLRFVGSFTPDSRPELLALSGGEALLRPALVRELATRARSVGTRTTLLSGLFFASKARIPPAIHAAIQSVDHFSVSFDAFHEREVARADVFRVLAQLLGEGMDLSLHIVGMSEHDPYVAELVEDVRKTFDDRIPMLVNLTSAFGRARAWLTRKLASAPPPVVEANPCLMAAWPVVGFDGTIVACGNDDALDQRPPHLCLGHAAVDDWATIRARSLESPMLRAIRLYGPSYVAAEHGDAPRCDGYCDGCLMLDRDVSLGDRVADHMRKPSTAIVEREAQRLIHEAGARGFVRQQGVARHAELMSLGHAPASAPTCD